MTDILANNGLSRPGDLITADTEHCYLFLNACPQSVMLVTLNRIFGGSADALFEDVRFLVKREEIQTALDALSREAGKGTLPDYSPMFGSVPTQDAGLPAAMPDRVTQPLAIAINTQASRDQSAPQTAPQASPAQMKSGQ